VPNPYGGFILDGRRGAITGERRSLVLRRGVVDGLMDLYALCDCCCEFIFLHLFFFLIWGGVWRDTHECFLLFRVSFFLHSKIKYEGPGCLFIFFFYLFVCISIAIKVS
jgi:hypothetical protein